MKNSNDWITIRTDISKQVDLLPPVARNLYESGQFEKVKRLMSDQIKKKSSGNEKYVLKCEETRSMVAKIIHFMSRQFCTDGVVVILS